jgi:hypothetical protein
MFRSGSRLAPLEDGELDPIIPAPTQFSNLQHSLARDIVSRAEEQNEVINIASFQKMLGVSMNIVPLVKRLRKHCEFPATGTK